MLVGQKPQDGFDVLGLVAGRFARVRCRRFWRAAQQALEPCPLVHPWLIELAMDHNPHIEGSVRGTSFGLRPPDLTEPSI